MELHPSCLRGDPAPETRSPPPRPADACRMANASPCLPSGPLSQAFFPQGRPSPPGSVIVQHGTPVAMPTPAVAAASAVPQPGFQTMELGVGPGPGGAAVQPTPPTPSGVSFIIQIGLTRESVFLPQAADLAYIKQISCSIVDQKVSRSARGPPAPGACLPPPPPNPLAPPKPRVRLQPRAGNASPRPNMEALSVCPCPASAQSPCHCLFSDDMMI